MNVDEALSELESLDRSALAQRWLKTFGVPAPKSCQATLLRCALAWQIQAEAAGPASLRPARQLARSAIGSTPDLSPGTRLVREWQNVSHSVLVVDGGFEYNGRRWRSLSAIARAITGTHWSGPTFFGLRS